MEGNKKNKKFFLNVLFGIFFIYLYKYIYNFYNY